MPTVASKAPPNPTLLRALSNSAKGLSLGRPVQSFNSYIKSYEPSALPTIKSRKELFKTFCLDKKSGHYISFGLRAAVVALLNDAKTNQTPMVTTLITMNFNEEFSESITRSGLKKSAAQYFNVLFKSKIAKPFGVDDYVFVFEESSSGVLHVHMVCNIPVGCEKDLREKLWKSKWLFKDLSGATNSNALHMENRYRVRIYRSALTTDEAELLDMEIDSDPTWSFWEYEQFRKDDSGNEFCSVYRAKDFSEINVGLADYLSKTITENLFSGGKNYGMSRSLKLKMEPYINQVISEGKKVGRRKRNP